jgi:hypothetical protein
MTVISVALLGASGGETADEVQYQLRYLVRTNSRQDGPLTVRNAVPWRYGDVYRVGPELDLRSRAKSIKESPVSSAHFLDWHVDVEFGNIDTEKDLSNPLNDLIEAEMQWQPQSRRTWIDGEGKALANTAGEMYVDGMEIDDNLPTLTYMVNQPFFSETLANTVRNACNLTAWKGFPPRTAKLRSMTASRVLHKNIGIYFACRYAFSILTEEWALITPSTGYNEIKGTGINRKLVSIREGGRIITTPWFLDDKGKKIPAQYDSEGVLTGFTKPFHMQKFPKHTAMEFNTIFGFLG